MSFYIFYYVACEAVSGEYQKIIEATHEITADCNWGNQNVIERWRETEIETETKHTCDGCKRLRCDGVRCECVDA